MLYTIADEGTYC